MSKKMFKRSLALGALMAFVITGSAFAAIGDDFRDEYKTKYPGSSYGDGPYVSNGATIIEVNHNDKFESWYDFKDKPCGLEKRYYPGTQKLEGDFTLAAGDKGVKFTGFTDPHITSDDNNPNAYSSYLNSDLNGYELTINYTGTDSAIYAKGRSNNGLSYDGIENVNTDWGYVYKHIYTNLEKLPLDLPGFNIRNGNLVINSSNIGINGHGSIDVNTLKITSINNAITSLLEGNEEESHNLVINAKNIELIVGAKGNAIQVNNAIEIKSEVLDIKNIEDAEYEKAIRVYGANANVDVGTLNISGATGSSKVDNGGILNLSANSGEVTNDFEAASTGTVDTRFGTSVNWSGKFVTADDATKGALDLSGTWNLTGASSLTEANFGAGSVLKINGADFTNNDLYALNGVGKDAKLTVVDGAKIVIADGKLDGVYNVAKDFATNEGANWTLQADDALWYVDWTYLDEDANTLQGTIKAKTAQDMVDSGVGTNENKEILVEIANTDEGVNPTVDAIKELTSVESNLAPEQQQKAIAAVLQVGEAGGFTGNVVSVSKQVNGSVGARNSFSGPKHGGPRHRGGHGPSVTEEANGSAIWAQYVHGKDKVDGIDMGGVENAYESQFNGVVLGADFKQVGSYASGIAFNYGEGDSHSKKNVVQSDSEFDFWGVSYYGAVKKQDTNFIFDIGYSESDSDVEQVAGSETITANPEASTWTAGVKVEKLIDKGAVQIVPYAGLRFMTIDTDEYEAKGSTDKLTYYSTERQNIWLLPVGVSLSQENVYDSGWIVTPKADLSYTWAMGDTDSSMTVNMPGVGYYDLGYTVMDDGSFMATVGLDAQKEDWTFGVAYSYQKGDSTRSDRWYVNARYSF